MKRHKNWQEWGKRRALQHVMSELSVRLMNECIDEMFRKNPIWDLIKSKNSYLPFASGGTMRIPLQYQNPASKSMIPERGETCHHE